MFFYLNSSLFMKYYSLSSTSILLVLYEVNLTKNQKTAPRQISRDCIIFISFWSLLQRCKYSAAAEYKRELK